MNNITFLGSFEPSRSSSKPAFKYRVLIKQEGDDCPWTFMCEKHELQQLLTEAIEHYFTIVDVQKIWDKPKPKREAGLGTLRFI